MFSEDEKLQYCSEDIRFTVNKDMLYASILGWPQDGRVLIKSGTQMYPGEINEVTMLGDGKPLVWEFTEDGLAVTLPKQKPCDHAWVLKIARQRPF